MKGQTVLIGCGLLFILVGAIGLLSQRATVPVSSSCALLSETEGNLEHVLCHVNSARRAALRNAALASAIVNSLPPRIKILLTTNDARDFTIAANTFPERIETTAIETKVNAQWSSAKRCGDAATIQWRLQSEFAGTLEVSKPGTS